MFLRKIIDKRIQILIREILSKALLISVIICIDGFIEFLKYLLFPSGDFSLEIIIFLGKICAVFLMAQLVFVVILERIQEIKKLIGNENRILS